MKKGSTLFLKFVVVFFGLLVAGLCLVRLPLGISSPSSGMYRPLLIGMYFPAIPFFVALYQTLKLLSYIDTNTAFSDLSVKALQRIKYCGIIISVMYALGMPYILHVADLDDVPGVVVISLVFTFASLVIAVFAAVLTKLLQSAIDIKSENDLTV